MKIRDFLPDGQYVHEKIEAKYRVDTSKEVMRPETLLELVSFKYGSGTQINSRLFSAGNFSVITGKGKAKKTYLTSLLSSLIVSGISAFNFKPIKSTLAIFDTEQSDYDAWRVGKRIKQLSEAEKLEMFALREMTHLERMEFITEYIKHHKPKFVVIDGIADLVYSINEEQEALRIQEMLLYYTKTYNCHILCVIHQNKGDNFATGFLGSALIKKAETVISIQKDERTKTSVVSCDYIRGSVEFEDFYLDVQDGLPVVMDIDKIRKTHPTPTLDL